MKKPVVSDRMKRREARKERHHAKSQESNPEYEGAKGWAVGNLMSRGGCFGVFTIFVGTATALWTLPNIVN